MKRFINTVALLSSVLMLGALPLATTAHAQFDPESGDTGQWQPPPPAQPQPPPQQAQPQPPPQQAQPPAQNAWQQQNQQPGWMGEERPPAMGGQTHAPNPTSGDDHSQMVGHMGVSFFGVQSIQVGVVAADHAATLRAPTIGIRRWLTDSIGLDAGLGLGIGSFSTSKATAGDSVVLSGTDSVFAVGLHVGLPIALSHSGHFAALLIPEVDFGYASAKLIIAPTNPDQDITLTGIDFRLGVRVGGEVHFGFWDLPQLSLQGTLGLGIRYQSGDANDNIDLASGGISETGSAFSVDSFVNDIVNGTIRINYYF